MSRQPSAAVPRESDEPVLQFAFARRMRYAVRMRWVAGLVAAGMIAQVAFLSVLPGIPLLAAAVGLCWVVGFDNALDRRGLQADAAWRRVPFERLRSIVRLDDEMRRWDASVVDVSSPMGCLALGATSACLAGVSVVVGAAFGVGVGLIVGVDAVVLVLLQWLSGMRSVHRKPDLVLKAKHLDEVVSRQRAEVDAVGALHAQLLLREHDGGASPDDARILVDVAEPPGKLLTVQGQVVLNRVQGTPYPYFYCVVVADAGGGLARFAERLAPGGSGTTIEVKSQEDVDVVVVRQTTTSTSGYHTKPAMSRQLLVAALDVATTFRDAARTASASG